MNNSTMVSNPNKIFVLILIWILVCSMALADGDSRTVIQAEKEFGGAVLNTFAKAVPSGPEGWENTGESSEIADLKTVYTEINEPLRLEYCVAWQDSKRMMEAQEQLNNELLKVARKPGFTGEEIDGLMEKMAIHDVKARIDIKTNISSEGIYEKAALGPSIAGGLVYQTPGEYSSNSGWRESSTYVFLGNHWEMGTSGGTYINFTPEMEATSSTLIQNIVVKIQADPDRAKQLIQKMDWDALKALLNK
jgi:hypothetical protein